MKKLCQNYYATIVFTVLAILNLFSPWGSFKFRLVMLLFNLIAGWGSDFMANYSNLHHKNLLRAVAM